MTYVSFFNSNGCSIFRPWQGWTSLSSIGPGEGTLRVLPMLSLATSYIMLRPFFRPRNPRSPSLKFSDWEPDTNGTAFPGSAMQIQELNSVTHPHLSLERTMISIPRVEPGDQVYCAYRVSFFRFLLMTTLWQDTATLYMLVNCHITGHLILPFSISLRFPLPLISKLLVDIGASNDSHLYFATSASYLKAQRSTFLAGLPAP